MTIIDINSHKSDNNFYLIRNDSYEFILALKYNEKTFFSINTQSPEQREFYIKTYEEPEIIGKYPEILKDSSKMLQKYLELILLEESTQMMNLIKKKFNKTLSEKAYLFVNENENENGWIKKFSLIKYDEDETLKKRAYFANLSSNTYLSEPFRIVDRNSNTLVYHLKSTLDQQGKILTGNEIKQYFNKIGFPWIYEEAMDYVNKKDNKEDNLIPFPNKRPQVL